MSKNSRGPQWDVFKGFVHGRIVQHEEKTGIIIGELGAEVKILWVDEGTKYDVGEYKLKDMKKFVEDEFDPTFAFKRIRRFQENGWHRAGDDGFIDAECPNAKQGEIPEEGVVGLTKAIYPPDVCLTKGDIELDSWINDPKILDDEGDFEIEKIVDQRTSKGKNQYLVKWKGYQLNPGTRDKKANGLLKKGDWMHEKDLKEAVALDDWEGNKPQYYLDAVTSETPVKKKRQQGTPSSSKRRR